MQDLRSMNEIVAAFLAWLKAKRATIEGGCSVYAGLGFCCCMFIHLSQDSVTRHGLLLDNPHTVLCDESNKQHLCWIHHFY